MRKTILEALVNQYDANRSRFTSENERITLLKSFLNTHAIKQRLKSEEVYFHEFAQYLRINNKDPEKLFSQEYFASQIKSTALFLAFNNEESPKNVVTAKPPFILTELPIDLRHRLFSTHLTAGDIASLAQTAKALNVDTKSSDIWKQKLLMAGCNKDLLIEVINTGSVVDYKNLYKTFLKAQKMSNIGIIQHAWELLILSGELSAVEYAIKNGLINKDMSEQDKEKILHHAVLSGNINVLEILHKHQIIKIEVSATPISGKANKFLTAAASGNMEMLHYILDVGRATIPNFNPATIKSSEGASLLHFAVASGNKEIMQETIKLGIDPKAVDNNGMNVLHWATVWGNVNMMKAAKQLGINPNSTDKLGFNILHLAVNDENIFKMNAALRFGVDAASVTNAKTNILHFAAKQGNVVLMRAVRKLGIDPKAVNVQGYNALHFAAMSNNIDAVHEAIKYGNELKSETTGKHNALHIAALDGCVDVMREVVKLGIDPKSVNKSGYNVLHYAAEGGNIDAIHFAVLDLGISIDSRTNLGRNALMAVLMTKKIEVETITILRTLGINMATVDNQGHDATWYANQLPNQEDRARALAALTAELPVQPTSKIDAPSSFTPRP